MTISIWVETNQIRSPYKPIAQATRNGTNQFLDRLPISRTLAEYILLDISTSRERLFAVEYPV